MQSKAKSCPLACISSALRGVRARGKQEVEQTGRKVTVPVCIQVTLGYLSCTQSGRWASFPLKQLFICLLLALAGHKYIGFGFLSHENECPCRLFSLDQQTWTSHTTALLLHMDELLVLLLTCFRGPQSMMYYVSFPLFLSVASSRYFIGKLETSIP